jgi:hypothetical protein
VGAQRKGAVGGTVEGGSIGRPPFVVFTQPSVENELDPDMTHRHRGPKVESGVFEFIARSAHPRDEAGGRVEDVIDQMMVGDAGVYEGMPRG